MRCPACAELLPHDRGRWPEHQAMCTGNSVEQYMEKFAAVAESVGRMVMAGGAPLHPMLLDLDEPPARWCCLHGNCEIAKLLGLPHP